MIGGVFETAPVEVDVRHLAQVICRGGWPASLDGEDIAAGDVAAQYLNAPFTVSARKKGLDGRIARRIAVSLARNCGRSVTHKKLYADSFAEDPSLHVSDDIYYALNPYLTFFDDQYFIEEQMGWDAPIKSRSRVRSKPKHTFADPSLPASLLSMTPVRLLRDIQTFGTLFEELCLRDVRAYVSAMGMIPDPAVYYYGDADGLDVDIIIELPDGRWAALEVKLNEAKVADAEKNLLRLRNKVGRNPAAHNPEPEFMAVLVGKATYCRRLPSGVYVAPITELGA